MATTFNQIPPLAQGKIYFDVCLGDLMFAETPEEFLHCLQVYRVGSSLVMECGEFTMSKVVRDHDDEVDVYLHAFYELIDEVLPRLSQK